VPIGDNGDTYDRYVIRIEEMRQSLKIISQAVENIPEGEYLSHDEYPLYVKPTKKRSLTTMEGMIFNFKSVMEGIKASKRRSLRFYRKSQRRIRFLSNFRRFGLSLQNESQAAVVLQYKRS
jgi:NADH:ubiquinone oxidoreductase 49 kD subunit 7